MMDYQNNNTQPPVFYPPQYQQSNYQPQQHPPSQYQATNYPPPQYAYPPTQVYIQQQPSSPGNGHASAGFAFAMISLFLGWIPFLGQIFWLLGLIFSIVGLAVSGRRKGAGRGKATAGLIISIIDIIIIVVVLILIFSAGIFSGCGIFDPYYW